MSEIRKRLAWCYPRQTGDAGEDRLTLALHDGLFLLAAGILILVIRSAAWGDGQSFAALLSLEIIVISSIATNSAGKRRAAVLLGSFGVLLICGHMVAHASDGFRSTAMLGFPGLLVIAVMVHRTADYLALSFATFATVTGLGLAEIHGVLPVPPIRRTPTDYDAVLIVDIILLVTTAFGWFISRNSQRALKELRTTNARYSIFAHALQSAGECVTITDTEDRVLYVNRSFLDTYGYTEDQIIGRHVSILRSGRTPASLTDAIRAATLDGNWKGELWNRASDGREFPISLVASPVYDEHRCRVALVGVARDITDRWRSEQALRESEERYRCLSNLATEGVMIHERGVILDLNLAFARLFGYEKPEDLIGKVGSDLLLIPESRERIGRRMDARETGTIEVTGARRDGSTFEAETDSHPTQYFGREATFVVCRDVSSRKRAEEERSQLQSQFHQAQKMESIGRLAGGVAHDFNNLLTVINGYAELLIGALEGQPRLAGQSQQIAKAGQGAAALTRQLLAFSRKQRLEPGVFDVNAVVDEMQSMLRRLVSERIEIVLRLAPAPVTVLADRHQLEQVIMNLAVNAGDSMPGGGQLTIETSMQDMDGVPVSSNRVLEPGTCCVLTVRDTGHGMDSNTLARIFEPFFTTKAVDKGTGLGLSVVQGIVVQSGGRVMVDSVLGKGSAFHIYLPATPCEHSAREIHCPGEAAFGAETILLVEDQDDVRRFTAEVLRGHGYHVLDVADPRRALEIHHAQPVDLLITDVVMPGMSGVDLVCTARLTRQRLPALFISGYSDETDDRQWALLAGEPFLQKPFSPQALALKVRATLDASRAGS